MDDHLQSNAAHSIEDVTRLGEGLYLNKLKDELERGNYGDFVVIEPFSEEYFVNSDLTKALQEATSKFPMHLFHIVKIGTLQHFAKHRKTSLLNFG